MLPYYKQLIIRKKKICIEHTYYYQDQYLTRNTKTNYKGIRGEDNRSSPPFECRSPMLD